MTFPVRSLFALTASLVLLCILLTPSWTRAHPPWAPYDDTRFAPITSFGPAIGIEVVADRMTSPLKGVHAPGQPNTLYVVDQPGILWKVDLTRSPDPINDNKTPFLDVRLLIGELGVCGPNTFDERGLLGVAFHPNYQTNGKFYTYTSEQAPGGPYTFPTMPIGAMPDHDNVVSEWQVSPVPVTPASMPVSRRELIRVIWPQFNHDGGDLAFGPDGNLYISMGDGGSADDADGEPFILARPRYPQNPGCTLIAPSSGHQGDGNAQKLNTPLGKILRIGVDAPFTGTKPYRVPADNPFVNTPGALPEIYAFGFRNPYRMSFDLKRVGSMRVGERDELYLGDVGQNDLEEVDVVERGVNYGWNCKEGTKWFHINGPEPGTAEDDPDPARPLCDPMRNRFRDPIAQYDLHHEGHSVIGGYVYHGSRIPMLRGRYVFGDFSLLFKFPRGPHDYGRLFVINAAGHSGHVDRGRGDGDNDRGRHGLRRISELMVLPGGAVSLAVLGMGQDAHGEIYVTGNVSGVPFPDPGPQGTGEEGEPPPPPIFNGRVLRIVAAPEPVTDDE